MPTDIKDNTINYGGSILISEKEEVNNFVFTDKLDSNLEFESISFFNGNKEIKCKAECNNGVVKLTISDDLTELQGKVIQWKMTCRYIGDEKPTQKITISNTANIIVNDESYDSNKVNVYIPTVMEKKSVQKDNGGDTSKDITSDNQTSENNSSNDKLTSAINSSQQNSGSTQPYTGSNGNKAPMLLFSGVVIIAAVYAVYRLRKIKRKKKK